MSTDPSIPAPPAIDFTNQTATPTAPAVPDTPLPNSSTPDAATNAAPASNSLGSYFGLTPEQMQTNDAASAALKPVVEMLAQAGMNSVPAAQETGQPITQTPPTQQQVQTPASTPAVNDVSFDNIDMKDVPPETVKALKAVVQQQQTRFQQVLDASTSAQQAAIDARNTYEGLQQQQSQQQSDELYNRAGVYLDSLALPKYGVGVNRSMIQNMATQQVMNAAGNIIRGMKSSTGGTPQIEEVMAAALLLVDGKLPSAPAPASAAPGLPPSADQRSSSVGTPGAAPVAHSGSAGSGSAMMNDAEFMSGARAILAR